MMDNHPFPSPTTTYPGWPWEPAWQEIPAHMPDGAPWPKISIVTPSYQQADYLEATIRSVLLQGYPNLEYIIIDGGSKDGSREIIHKYAPWLHYWVSEADKGQSHAINKGFAHSSGEIMAWINSDDFYAPGALFLMATCFAENNTLWATGLTHRIDAQGNMLKLAKKRWEETHELWYVGSLYPQPGVFWRRKLWDLVGQLDESLQYSFDYDFWLRIIQHQIFATWVNEHIASFRVHQESKTALDQLKFMHEREIVYRRYSLRKFPMSTRFTIWKRRRLRKMQILMDLSEECISPRRRLWLLFKATPWKFLQKEFIQSLKSKKFL